jgi:hypothetical protein
MGEVNNLYNHAEGIFYIYASGELSLQYMKSGTKLLNSSDSLPRKLKILEDATKAFVKISIDEIKLIAQEIEKIVSKYDYIFHAVVLSDPNNTAFAFLMSDLVKSRKYILKVFSTNGAAREWLLSSEM